jgi:hypothetical protein
MPYHHRYNLVLKLRTTISWAAFSIDAQGKTSYTLTHKKEALIKSSLERKTQLPHAGASESREVMDLKATIFSPSECI